MVCAAMVVAMSLGAAWGKRDWKRPSRAAEEVDSSGLGCDALNALMDRIAAENAGKPFVVTLRETAEAQER